MLILLERTVAVYRLSDLGGDKQGYITLTTTLDSTIQPLGDEKLANDGGSHSKLFKIFCDVNSNVREGDEIRDKDGNIYEILAGGVENRNDGMMADYMGLTVKKKND